MARRALLPASLALLLAAVSCDSGSDARPRIDRLAPPQAAPGVQVIVLGLGFEPAAGPADAAEAELDGGAMGDGGTRTDAGPGADAAAIDASTAPAADAQVDDCDPPAAGQVTFDGIVAPVVCWTDERITVTVPTDAQVGRASVLVIVGGRASALADFEVLPLESR